MTTQEVPRQEWTEFFDSFSRRHLGWLVSVEVMGPDIGAQAEAREMPLQGITAELKPGDESIISIMVGNSAEDHLTHTITGPSRVNVKVSGEGTDEAVEIESEDGLTTLVRFRSPISPEMVDELI
ncbi:MAG TPA: DUF5335 family protein [Blastocatellia bacterium]|nr:DUF5335 family protein [Blastocatellia bacterium]